MRFINKINDRPKQSFILAGEAGESINFNLNFLASQNAWFFDIASGNFTSNGMRLSVSPNILRCFKNQITYGLACISVDGYDPKSIDDFTSGRIQIYTLNAADVLAVESGLFT